MEIPTVPGTVFETPQGTKYKVLSRGKINALRPQPNKAGPEYVHLDGKMRVCSNPRCSNLVSCTDPQDRYCLECRAVSTRRKEGTVVEI